MKQFAIFLSMLTGLTLGGVAAMIALSTIGPGMKMTALASTAETDKKPANAEKKHDEKETKGAAEHGQKSSSHGKSHSKESSKDKDKKKDKKSDEKEGKKGEKAEGEHGEGKKSDEKESKGEHSEGHGAKTSEPNYATMDFSKPETKAKAVENIIKNLNREKEEALIHTQAATPEEQAKRDRAKAMERWMRKE